MNDTVSFTDALMTSLAGALAMLFAAVPKIIGFLVILLVGWFLAGLLAKAVAALLRTVKFNELAERAGFTGFMRNMGVHNDASGFIAAVTKWFIRLIAMVVASMRSDCLRCPRCCGNSCCGFRTLLWL